MERETGFEPATSTLARLHSTTELLPLNESRVILAYAQGRVNQTERGGLPDTVRTSPQGRRPWERHGTAVSALAQFSGAQAQQRIPGQD